MIPDDSFQPDTDNNTKEQSDYHTSKSQPYSLKSELNSVGSLSVCYVQKQVIQDHGKSTADKRLPLNQGVESTAWSKLLEQGYDCHWVSRGQCRT